MTCYYQTCPSPIGRLHLVADDTHLRLLAHDANWPDFAQHFAASRSRPNAVIRDVLRQLDDYFAGHRRDFSIPLAPEGSAFQRRVWDALASIPYGETASYREQAGRIGQPTASRAVGHANGRNPISILVPCHRVIAASGALAGYAGGLAAKAFLLDHETRNTVTRSAPAECRWSGAARL